MENANLRGNQFQSILFDQISSKLDYSISLVDVVAEVLNVSNDAAYRRLRGEKKLDIQEIALLCKKFSISMDSIFAIDNTNLVFNYSPLDIEQKEVYYKYISRLNKGIKNLVNQNDLKFLFSAVDIPIYHFMPYKELTLFKLYSWNNGVYNTSVKFESFLEDYSNSELFETYASIFNSYKNISSVEIWTEKTIDPLLRLINYYNEIGCFENQETKRLLHNQLLGIVENLGAWSSKGKKGNKENSSVFDLYLSEIEIDNNFLLIKSEQNLQCSIKLFTINSISTSDSQFCDETEKWFNNLIKKSTCISRISQKEHYKFIQNMIKRVNSHMNVNNQ